MSRQQDLMGQAIEHITRHPVDPHNEAITKWNKIYGGLYHKLPVLIRTCGLCQALAFVNSKTKAEGNRGSAHQAVMSEVTEVLSRHCGVSPRQGDEGGILNAVRGLNSRQYALATRILLQSLVFHKRFAESILGVEATDYTAEDKVAEDKEA